MMRLTFFAIAGIVLAAPSARADEARAAQLFEQGRALAREGRCSEAIPILLDSVREAQGVGPLLNLGLCYSELGKTATAHRYYVRADDVARARGDPRSAEAHERALALEAKQALLTVRADAATEPDLALVLDGEPLPRASWNVAQPVDTGVHVIEARSSRRAATTLRVNIHADGDVVELAVPALAAEEARPPPQQKTEQPERMGTQRLVGWTLAGVGAGALLTGGVFGLLSAHAHSSLVDRCPTYPTCDSSQRAQLDDLNDGARTKGTIATATIIPGAVLVVAGVVLVLTAH